MKKIFPRKSVRIFYFALTLLTCAYLVTIPDLGFVFNIPVKMDPVVFKAGTSMIKTQGSAFSSVLHCGLYSSSKASSGHLRGSIVCLECQNIPVMHKSPVFINRAAFTSLALENMFHNHIIPVKIPHPPKAALA